MISIHLYGKLRRYAPDNSPSANSVVEVEAVENETLAGLLERVGIDPDELYTIFINHKLLASRTKFAHFLGYQQVRERDVPRWDLSIRIKDGDRIGLFGPDMPALVV